MAEKLYFKPLPGEQPVIRFLGETPDLGFPHISTPNVSTHDAGSLPGCPLCQKYNAERTDIQNCTCVFSCADDPKTMCSLSGQFHVHPESGPCPLHPEAPGDL